VDRIAAAMAAFGPGVHGRYCRAEWRRTGFAVAASLLDDAAIGAMRRFSRP
jgi:hypothetical protein